MGWRSKSRRSRAGSSRSASRGKLVNGLSAWVRAGRPPGGRYSQKQTGEWNDAGSLRSTDLPALILGLEAAHTFMATTPLPGQPVEEEEHMEDTPPQDNRDIPF